jgi:signal recognition particle GTPase
MEEHVLMEDVNVKVVMYLMEQLVYHVQLDLMNLEEFVQIVQVVKFQLRLVLFHV